MKREYNIEPTPEAVDNAPVYALDLFGHEIDIRLNNELGVPASKELLRVAEPPNGTSADYGLNIVRIANENGERPLDLATRLADSINSSKGGFISKASATGPFLNFELDMGRFGSTVVEQVLTLNDEYGKEKVGNGQRVVIDMSSPNIAKRMSIGHLRSTIIGDSLASIYRSEGYDVIRDNHLGDWGTQFGKLIVAIKKWGNEEEIMTSEDPIETLQELYVKFHDEVDANAVGLRQAAKEKWIQGKVDEVPGLAEAIEDVSQEIMTRKKIGREDLEMEDKVVEDAMDRVIVTALEKEGREWFLKLEKGDPEARRIWKLCVDLSIKEFNKIYEVLGVDFELTLGESFYEDKLKETIEIVRKNEKSSTSKGALGLDLNDKGLGFAIVEKSDGASIYMTRDIAGAIYRQNELKADKILYVVGGDQQHYFDQLFEVLTRLGYKVGERSKHVYFGMITLPEGKMSTRKGRVILLKDVINEGYKRAAEVLEEKNPELYKDEKLKNEVVRQIAIGAMKWNDLSQDAKNSIVFDWDKALNFEGKSAPYVQYTAVRANSILESSGYKKEDLMSIPEGSYNLPYEKALIRTLSEFPNAVRSAMEIDSPTKIASYVYELAKRFNSFYTNVPVLKAETNAERTSRLALTVATYQAIKNALALLGIEVPVKM